MTRIDFNLFFELTVQGHGVAPLTLIALGMYIAGAASPVNKLITDNQEPKGIGCCSSLTIDDVCVREHKDISRELPGEGAHRRRIAGSAG